MKLGGQGFWEMVWTMWIEKQTNARDLHHWKKDHRPKRHRLIVEIFLTATEWHSTKDGHPQSIACKSLNMHLFNLSTPLKAFVKQQPLNQGTHWNPSTVSNPRFCILGADVMKEGDVTGLQFRYPSYVQNIMGDIFSMGFGPFRCIWCSMSSTVWHPL